MGFAQTLEELSRCHQDIPCGQYSVSQHLPYRHILRTIVKKLNEKIKKIQSVHLQSAADPRALPYTTSLIYTHTQQHHLSEHHSQIKKI